MKNVLWVFPFFQLLLHAGNLSEGYRNQENSAYASSWTTSTTEDVFVSLTSTTADAASAWPDQPEEMTLVADSPAILWEVKAKTIRFLFTTDGVAVHASWDDPLMIQEGRLNNLPFAMGLVENNLYPGVTLRHVGFQVQTWPEETPPDFIEDLLNNEGLMGAIQLHPRFKRLLMAADFLDEGISSLLPDEQGEGPSGTYITYSTVEYEIYAPGGVRVTRGKNEITGERFHHYRVGSNRVVDVTDFSNQKSYAQRNSVAPVTQVIPLDFSECQRIEEECRFINRTCTTFAYDARRARRAFWLCGLLSGNCELERRALNILWDSWHRCRHDYDHCTNRVEACIADIL